MIRKIQNQVDIDKKNKRSKAILSIFLLLLLVLSTLGYAFFSNPLPDEEEITNTTPISNEKIKINYQGSIISLISTQEEIENISVNLNITPENYAGKVLYLDVKNEGILSELASNVSSISSRIQEECYVKCQENLPEKTCTDNLIVWKESSVRKVYQENNCIFIEGDIRSADAFLYKLFNPSQESITSTS